MKNLREARHSLLWIAVFCLSIAIVPLSWITGLRGTDHSYGDEVAAPALMRDGRVNTALPQDFEAWWERSFPWRSSLVSLWNRAQQTLFHSSGSERIVVGRDGWLFFAETLPDHSGSSPLTDLDLRRIARTLELEREYLARQDIRFHVALAPNKATLYPEKMPVWLERWLAPAEPARHIERLGAELAATAPKVDWIDLETPLRAAKTAAGEHGLYHALDSHWNQEGAQLAAAVLGQAMEVDQEALRALAPTVWRHDWPADLARMYYPDRVTHDWQCYLDLPQTYQFTRAVRSVEDVRFATLAPDGSGHLYTIRDSFSNVLVDIWSRLFAAVDYDRAFPHALTTAAASGCDRILLLIAERNLASWLQGTPVLPAPSRDPAALGPGDLASLPTLSLDCRAELSKRGELGHLNVRWDGDDTAARSVTRVLLALGDEWYEAFPLCEDENAHDHVITPGFSLYLEDMDVLESFIGQHGARLEGARLLVETDGSWFLRID
ncbi:MAG: hypothetical protein QM296_01995 [Bacillota bacterium]|nr:hypothetical protein [Bacillota bacterium]